MSIKVLNAVPLEDLQLLIFFENGIIKKFNVKPLMKDYPEFEDLDNVDLFNLVHVEPGGYGISWNEDLDCSEGELWENGVEVPLSPADFLSFAKHSIVNTYEATELLNCSRQNIEDLIKRGKLHPLKAYPKNKLFLKSEVVQRTWQVSSKRGQ